MKFSELASFVRACSELVEALTSGRKNELADIVRVLSEHPDQKAPALAKRLAKQQRGEGNGLIFLSPLIAFCRSAGLSKQARALDQLMAASTKFGINSVDELRAALEAPVASAPKATKMLNVTVIEEYARSLLVEGLPYGEAAKIVSLIEEDKRVKVNDAREIASRVVGVSITKGRTRPQYIEEIRSKFLVADREERKRDASHSVNKPWGNA